MILGAKEKSCLSVRFTFFFRGCLGQPIEEQEEEGEKAGGLTKEESRGQTQPTPRVFYRRAQAELSCQQVVFAGHKFGHKLTFDHWRAAALASSASERTNEHLLARPAARPSRPPILLAANLLKAYTRRRRQPRRQ